MRIQPIRNSFLRVAWRFPGSPAMARDGELIQNALFLSSRRHNFPPKLKTIWNVGRWNNNTIFQNELFSHKFLTVDVCSLAAQKPWWCCESRKMATLMNSSFFMLKTSLLRNYSVIMLWLYCKVVQWYSMRSVCIAGYLINYSFKKQWIDFQAKI